MNHLTGRTWSEAMAAAIRFECTPIWVPVASVEQIAPRRYSLGVDTRNAYRGNHRGDQCGLDESVEGAAVQHAAGRHGAPEWKGEIRLVDLQGQPARIVVQVEPGSRAPAPRDAISIFPPSYLAPAADYLGAHADLGASTHPLRFIEERVRRALAMQARQGAAGAGGRPGLPPPAGRALRARQQDVLGLLGLPLSVCWGPPGTGKTTTLGAAAAAVALAGGRLLVVAPTNVAADGASLAVDAALTASGMHRSRGDVVRVQMPQLVDAFRAQNQDLLVWADERAKHTDALLKARTTNASARADLLRSIGVPAADALNAAADAQAVITALDEHWRRRQGELVAGAKVVISTVRTAVNQQFTAAFQTVFADEASMISISDGALLLHQQARAQADGRLIFFGDHRQLPPVPPQARHDAEGDANEEADARAPVQPGIDAWFGHDILSYLMDLNPPMVMLDEQSRMNAQLCKVVSAQSYEGRLRAVDAPAPGVAPRLNAGICILDPLAVPGWLTAPKLPFHEVRGPHQRDSLQATAALARHLHLQGLSVLVCTPFKAQASLIRRALGDLTDIRAGTVHRLQGQEGDVCIFDPAQAAHPFITRHPVAPRLINVAASRAKRALVISNTPEYLGRNRHLEPYLNAGTILR